MSNSPPRPRYTVYRASQPQITKHAPSRSGAAPPWAPEQSLGCSALPWSSIYRRRQSCGCSRLLPPSAARGAADAAGAADAVRDLASRQGRSAAPVTPRPRPRPRSCPSPRPRSLPRSTRSSSRPHPPRCCGAKTEGRPPPHAATAAAPGNRVNAPVTPPRPPAWLGCRLQGWAVGRRHVVVPVCVSTHQRCIGRIFNLAAVPRAATSLPLSAP